MQKEKRIERESKESASVFSGADSNKRILAQEKRKGKTEEIKKRAQQRAFPHVVPHRSTTPARACLTSLFGWEAVRARLIWPRWQITRKRRPNSPQLFQIGRRATYLPPVAPKRSRRPIYLPTHRRITLSGVAYKIKNKSNAAPTGSSRRRPGPSTRRGQRAVSAAWVVRGPG